MPNQRYGGRYEATRGDETRDPQACGATFCFEDRDVELPIRRDQVPRVGERILWTYDRFHKGEFIVTQVGWHVDEVHGVQPSVVISLDPDPDDVPRETSEPEHEHDYTQTLAAWPSGPDGEIDKLKACACGAQITVSADDTECST